VRRHWRILLVLPVLAFAISLIWWRGPDWSAVKSAFTVVRWRWVFVAIGLNLLSVITRSLAWDTTIRQALKPPHPRFPLVFSAFCVGLFGNAVLPARAGELARVAVLRRRMPGRKGATATLVGSVFAHRMFDVPPTVTLVVWVLFAAKLPRAALVLIAAVLGAGVALFAVAVLVARNAGNGSGDGIGRIRTLLLRGREGLAVMASPVMAARALTFQFAGWFCQLLAVWTALRAFHIYEPLAAAGLVLVIMNVVTVVPFWPGNFGLVQIAVATSLLNYGVATGRGIAFGVGLQAIEASVGIGIGLVFLAREGLSYATLKQFEEVAEEAVEPEPDEEEPERARARVSR
jgi:uncharacterized membrane protein YbhN (UPF0104 family)